MLTLTIMASAVSPGGGPLFDRYDSGLPALTVASRSRPA
jgi:hypothetical protein